MFHKIKIISHVTAAAIIIRMVKIINNNVEKLFFFYLQVKQQEFSKTNLSVYLSDFHLFSPDRPSVYLSERHDSV